jgi:hypothetical protein
MRVFRPSFGRGLAVTIAVLCAVAFVLSLRDTGFAAVWQIGPWLALVVLVVWATYWNPQVGVDDAGVHVVNVFRTIDLPWPSIQRVDTKWALKLVTAYGDFTAWAAPAPGGIATARAAARGDLKNLPESTYGPGGSVRPGDVPSSPSGAAAAVVRRRWEELRDAGYLDDPKLESDRPPISWHWPVIGAMAGLLVLGLLGVWLA